MNANHYDAEKIRQLRRDKAAKENRAITQQEIATALGVDRQTIYRVEYALDVSYEMLCALADYYDVPVTLWLYPRPRKARGATA